MRARTDAGVGIGPGLGADLGALLSGIAKPVLIKAYQAESCEEFWQHEHLRLS